MMYMIRLALSKGACADATSGEVLPSAQDLLLEGTHSPSSYCNVQYCIGLAARLTLLVLMNNIWIT